MFYWKGENIKVLYKYGLVVLLEVHFDLLLV